MNRSAMFAAVIVALAACIGAAGCASESPGERACRLWDQALKEFNQDQLSVSGLKTVIRESVWPEARDADESRIVAAASNLNNWTTMINMESIDNLEAAFGGFRDACDDYS